MTARAAQSFLAIVWWQRTPSPPAFGHLPSGRGRLLRFACPSGSHSVASTSWLPRPYMTPPAPDTLPPTPSNLRLLKKSKLLNDLVHDGYIQT